MNLSNDEVKLLFRFIKYGDPDTVMRFLIGHPEWKAFARRLREEFNEIIQQEYDAPRRGQE